MGWGIALGGVADGYRAQRRSDDEHDEQAYQKFLRDQEKAARTEIAAVKSPVGSVVGSKTPGLTPDQAAASLGIDPETAAGLRTADDWNKYIQGMPPPTRSVPNDPSAGAPATTGDASSGAQMPAGAIPAGDEPVGGQVPSTAATPAAVTPAAIPAAAPAPAPQPVAPSHAPVPAAAVSVPEPLLRTVGPDKAHMAAAIQAAAANKGLSPNAVQAAVIAPLFESSYNPAAVNGSSMGLYGFQKPTFTGLGGNDQTIMNPDTQIAAGIKNMQGGDYYLSKALGRDPTTTEIYLYHQQGPAGSKALLTADPNKPAAQALLDAGVYHNHTAASQAINANLPAGAPANPTVAQFVGGWDVKTKAALKDVPRPSGHQAIDAPAGGNAPLPADQGGGAAAPQQAIPTEPKAYGLPTVDAQTDSQPTSPGGLLAYTTKDANGQDMVRLTNAPRYGTADDHDQQVISILQKHGMYDKAEALQSQVLQRQLLRHQVEAGGLELDTQKRFQAASMAAQSGDYGAFESAYNSSPLAQSGGTHIRVGQGQGGALAVGVYSNDTGKLLNTHAYANSQDMATQVAMLQDPKLLTQFVLQNRQLNIEQQNANTTSRNADTASRGVGVQERAEASQEPVRAAQVGAINADIENTRAANGGIVAESSLKTNAAKAQGAVIGAAPGSEAQAQAASTVRAMSGAIPTPPQPLMIGPGQTGYDANSGTMVTGVQLANRSVAVLPADIAHSAFGQSKELKNGEVIPQKDAMTGKWHYLVNGSPFDNPNDALAYLSALKAAKKK